MDKKTLLSIRDQLDHIPFSSILEYMRHYVLQELHHDYMSKELNQVDFYQDNVFDFYMRTGVRFPAMSEMTEEQLSKYTEFLLAIEKAIETNTID